MDDPHHNNISFLTKGSIVEVTSNEDGSNGAWYVATVIHAPTNHHTRNNLVYVEYHNLSSEHGSSTRLREYANIAYVRPSPVPDTNPHSFKLNDVVDAFYRDGWWTGVVTAVIDSCKFVVTFRNPPEEIEFGLGELRVHKKWVGGKWVVQPQNQVTAGCMFTVGKKVEVSFESESLRDVWFPATVLKNSGNSTFVVEYQQPGAGDEGGLHKVTVDYHHIRPSPPHLRDKNFVLLEKVDAFYDFGWWCGVITKKLADNRYIVFFKHTKKEREFIHSRVRRHMEWKGGKWFNTSQGDTAVRTTHSLIDNQIEKATPIIGKLSPVATSVMKSKQQQNLDSNDKTSPNAEIINGDSVIKKKHPSVGQSENFDTEVSGMTDQAVSKKGDTAGKTAHSLVDNQIEQAIPIISKQSPVATSTTKRKRQKNLDSNDKTSPNDEIINDVSVTKKKHPSVDKPKGFDSEVSGMTDQSVSKKGDMAGKTAHSLVGNQIEQATSIIGKQSPVGTSITKRKQQKNLDSNDKTSPSDEIMNDDSSEKKKRPSVGQSEGADPEVSGLGQKHLDGNDQTSPNDEAMNDDSSKHPSDVDQSEGFDSEVSGMTDQAFSKTENLSHGKKVHSKRGKSIELKATTTDSSKKRGRLINELKSLQALTEGSKVDSVKPRTQEIVEKENATEDFPFVVLGLHCNRMTVSQGNMVPNPPDEKSPDVAKSDTKQPDVPLTPLTEVDQEGGEGDAASVALKRRRGRTPKSQALSPKTPATVNHEIKSVPSTLSVVEAGQRKEFGLTTGSGTQSLEENQEPVNAQSGLAGKPNEPLTKDKLPNKNPEQDLHVQGGQGTKKHPARKRKQGKRRRTISVNAESPAQVFGVDSQDASKEKADGSMEKDSTTDASVGKSLDTDDQPISKWFEGNHSSMDGTEGTVEQSSKASEGWLDPGKFPFIKSTALWKTLASMEAFRMLPQKPHFRPLLEGVKEGAQEGLAIGSMVTFSTMVDKTCSLKFDDPRSTLKDCLETLLELENNGFDVKVIRERLTGLLSIKDKHEELKGQSKGVVEKIEENNTQGKKIQDEIEEINRQIMELDDRRKNALLKKEKRISELDVMETVIEGIKQEIREVGAEFDGLAAAPFVV